MNILYISLGTCIQLFGVEMLGHKVCTSLILFNNANLFSKVFVKFPLPPAVHESSV